MRVTQIFPQFRDIHRPRTGRLVHVRQRRSSSRPSCSHNPRTSGTSIGDNSGNPYDKIRGSRSHNLHYSDCNTISFVPLPVVVFADKLKPLVSPLHFHEFGDMVSDLLLCLFPGFCLYKGLHNTTTRPNYIKQPTNPPTTRSGATV